MKQPCIARSRVEEAIYLPCTLHSGDGYVSYKRFNNQDCGGADDIHCKQDAKFPGAVRVVLKMVDLHFFAFTIRSSLLSWLPYRFLFARTSPPH